MESERQRATGPGPCGNACRKLPLSLNSIFELPGFVTSPGEGCPNRFFQLEETAIGRNLLMSACNHLSPQKWCFCFCFCFFFSQVKCEPCPTGPSPRLPGSHAAANCSSLSQRPSFFSPGSRRQLLSPCPLKKASPVLRGKAFKWTRSRLTAQFSPVCSSLQ